VQFLGDDDVQFLGGDLVNVQPGDDDVPDHLAGRL
jgi:hypothetical protein